MSYFVIAENYFEKKCKSDDNLFIFLFQAYPAVKKQNFDTIVI